MTSEELRDKFLNFFKEKGHAIIPSASLIPENDPTVLFTTAGMHPLVPYLLGQKHPEGKRLVNCQKCIRTGDIDDVGDDTHLTFFEMLGNWSMGDYWKDEAIKWSFEFLTKELKLPLEKLAFTCFAGDKDAPKDLESAEIWESLGASKDRIYFLPKKDNWWGPAGQTGPCGPDTEMFYWRGAGEPAKDISNKNWVEIWNDVFMQYVKDENGNYNPASQKNVDTGMGLERTLCVLNGKENVYETDLFLPIIKLIPEELDERKKRIIADHARAINALIADGVRPSNKEQGYVLRRLIRRIVAYEFLAKIDFLDNLIKSEVFSDERKKFLETLGKGIAEYSKIKDINAEKAFYLYQSFGLPFDILKELDPSKTKHLKQEDFEEELKKHQELSRTASAGMFKGGLADHSEQTTKLHTAAHLMLAGLRKVLGEDVYQKGSNITAERLRFDFSHKEKMTSGQIKDVENFVNGIIEKDLPVWFEEMTLEKAKELGAMGVFESKYGEMIKVYFVGKGDENVSKEICGGPHVERTGTLGHFKIQKEESSSSGVRRIKAILEKN
ncbi:MAG: alanine--tRNA ligase-related protein [Candidatus Staskawiczbacteria bacterium]|nr:alanine--tRNA ligase-related protein [Candidatus Staskawiczbacteria bacterium]